MEADNGSSKPLKIAFNGGQVLCHSLARPMKIKERSETGFQILGILKIKVNERVKYHFHC